MIKQILQPCQVWDELGDLWKNEEEQYTILWAVGEGLWKKKKNI